MSTSPDNDLDLEHLLFLPAWAQKPPDAGKRFSDFPADERGPQRKTSRGARPGGARGPRPPHRGGRDQREPAPDERPSKESAPLPEISVTFIPDEKGIDMVARQIRATGRAYPLFEIAQLILKKPERQQVRFDALRKPDGEIAQPLFLCAIDDTVWLSEADAMSHLLERHFSTFYQVERIAADPPKGTYTFVAQCGMSGVILGPPNYHGYQNELRKLHGERFSRMPFEAFKARVRIVKDEEIVKKWIEDQSWRCEYTCLNLPEPKTLSSREDVERHFREVHLPNLVQRVESHTLSGDAMRQLPDQRLQRLVRHHWEQQKRFPLQVVNVLSQQFASRGLQFFKVNKTITHVAVSRPHHLDMESTPVSNGVRSIVEFINSHPRCTRRQLADHLAPAPEAPPPEAPAGQPAAESPPAQCHEPTPEQTALIGDLHWLIHQGHVIEFANGSLETAKRPNPKPAPKTESRKHPQPPDTPSSEQQTAPADPGPTAAEATSSPPAEGSTAEPQDAAPTPTETAAENRSDPSTASPQPLPETPEARPS